MNDIECPDCGHNNEPSGIHEEDSGRWECYDCGFKFKVEIEYDPHYLIECAEHDMGEWRSAQGAGGWLIRDCKRCDCCEHKEAEAT